MRDPFDVPALWRALEARRVTDSTTWATIARATGVSASTLQRAQHADDLEADGMIQATRWLGLAPEAFCRAPHHRADARVRTIEGDGIVRVDTAALHRALDQRRERDALAWTEVASAMTSPRATAGALRGLEKGGRTSAQVLLSATRWLGQPCDDFLVLRPL